MGRPASTSVFSNGTSSPEGKISQARIVRGAIRADAAGLPMPEPLDFSIVIPAYNEAARLPGNIAAVAAGCGRLGGRWEILAVVEQSTDGTLERTRAAAADLEGVEVIDNGPQRGKGHAVRCGILRARGDIVFFLDADLSTPLEAVGRFLACFAAHPEVDALIGNRRHPRSRIARAQGPLRRLLSGVFNTLVRRIALPGANADTQCGFKAFRRDAARQIFSRQRLDGFSFDVEVLLLARALGLRVADLPVEWSDADATRLRVWRDGWRMLRDVWAVRRVVQGALRDHRPPGLPEKNSSR